MLKVFAPFIPYFLDRQERKIERRFSARDRVINDKELSKSTREHIRYLQLGDLIYQATGRRFTEEQIEKIELARTTSKNRLSPEILYSIVDNLEIKKNKTVVSVNYSCSNKISYYISRALSEGLVILGLLLIIASFLYMISGELTILLDQKFQKFQNFQTFAQILASGFLLIFCGIIIALTHRKPRVMKYASDILNEGEKQR